MVTIDSLQKVASTLYHGTIVDPYDLSFSHNTHDWHAIVRYNPSKSSKVNDSHVI